MGRYQYKREPLSADEANRLANACETHVERLVIWTFLDTGMRVSELAGLKRSQVDWQNHRVTIYGAWQLVLVAPRGAYREDSTKIPDDFTKLAAAVNDDMPGQPGGVSQTGPMDRILVSHFETAQGADFSVNCFPQSESGGFGCLGQYQGVLQPYAIYVPSGPMPQQGYGMT